MHELYEVTDSFTQRDEDTDDKEPQRQPFGGAVDEPIFVPKCQAKLQPFV